MQKNNTMSVTSKVVEALTPLNPEERRRVIHASLTLLGESDDGGKGSGGQGSGAGADDLPSKAKVWMAQNGLSMDELQQVFFIDDGKVEVIASDIPGKGKKVKTYNAYILTGISRLLLNGVANFDDKSARLLCDSAGCIDSANHAAYLRDKGNEFSGNKKSGWTLTAPGLKKGAQLIKELNK